METPCDIPRDITLVTTTRREFSQRGFILLVSGWSNRERNHGLQKPPHAGKSPARAARSKTWQLHGPLIRSFWRSIALSLSLSHATPMESLSTAIHTQERSQNGYMADALCQGSGSGSGSFDAHFTHIPRLLQQHGPTRRPHLQTIRLPGLRLQSTHLGREGISLVSTAGKNPARGSPAKAPNFV